MLLLPARIRNLKLQCNNDSCRSLLKLIKVDTLPGPLLEFRIDSSRLFEPWTAEISQSCQACVHATIQTFPSTRTSYFPVPQRMSNDDDRPCCAVCLDLDSRLCVPCFHSLLPCLPCPATEFKCHRSRITSKSCCSFYGTSKYYPVYTIVPLIALLSLLFVTISHKFALSSQGKA